jgi:hypothetical protein
MKAYPAVANAAYAEMAKVTAILEGVSKIAASAKAR